MSSDHQAHHAPTNFFLKYVFSTDHKVIGMQFMFTALLFVIIGGLLALGVRYQLAWPNQNVPYAKMLPGQMTAKAPEANAAHWKLLFGHQVELLADIQSFKTGDTGTLTSFSDKGLAVQLPIGTLVNHASSGQTTTLTAPINAFVDPALVIGSYNYAKQDALASIGTSLTLDTGESVTLEGLTIQLPDTTGQIVKKIKSDPIALSIRRSATTVNIKIDGRDITVAADQINVSKESLTTDAYLQLFTMHASMMIFFVIIPMLVGGFGNFLIPLMVGAKDMAFPKLNMLSFWLSFPAGIIMMITFWVLNGPAGGGWTMYPPLSSGHGFMKPELGTTMWIVAVGLVGFSSVVGALNYITTIINMRAPGMDMFRMPLTVWSLLITSILALFATPVLTAAMVLLLLDRTIGTVFFMPSLGGQPLLFQHLFWFYSHPAVYIMILPAMGVTSDILSVNARKPIFGYKPMVYAMASISIIGFTVWGHHMFQSGMNPVLGTTFMASTILISIPSAIKTFNWLGTLWGGNIRFNAPMLFALGFVSMFVIGGMSGIFMASAPVDIQMHDTYFIVAHIHYVLFGGSIMGIFAGLYYWFPKMFGRAMNNKWGVIHFIMTIIAFNGTFFLMHILGIGGHPRRYASIMEYPTLRHLQPLNVYMTLWAMALGAGQLPFFYNFFASLPVKLSRNIAAFLAVALGLPTAMGVTFWQKYSVDANQGAGNFNSAITSSMTAGIVFVVIAVAVVFIAWKIGQQIKISGLLQRLLYVVFLPAFLSPMILKQDIYILRDFPGLFAYRWLFLGLTALPGLAYLLICRPQDEFGADLGKNPWKANSLEWQAESPPIYTNFETIPTVYRGPYEYGSPVVEEDYLEQTRKLPDGVIEPSDH